MTPPAGMSGAVDLGTVRQEVDRALEGVIDPCSRINGSHWSLAQLGMIDGVDVVGPGTLRVRLLLDDPTCLYLADIFQDLKAHLLAVPGVDHVEFELRADVIWTEGRASDEVRVEIQRARAERLAALAVRSRATPSDGPAR